MTMTSRQKRTVTVGPVPSRDEPLRVVRVLHGARDLSLPLAGETVGHVRHSLKSLLNFGHDAAAFLDGEEVGDETMIPEGTTLELLLLWGQKGVGKVWKNREEICEAFGLDEVRFGQWMEKGLPVHEFHDGSVLLTETDFDAWSAATLGFVPSRSVSERPIEDVDPDAPYLSIKRAARVTTLSESHLRRAVRSGDLPASNVGSPAHPIWRIKRDDLDGWMKQRLGGNPEVPHNADMAALIRRHLPRL